MQASRRRETRRSFLSFRDARNGPAGVLGQSQGYDPKADFALLGRLGCRRRRRSHLAPTAFGTETFSGLNDLFPGLRRCEAFMTPLSASDVFLTVAIMSVTFLTEVGLFILIGML
jgi:hypothetical protein